MLTAKTYTVICVSILLFISGWLLQTVHAQPGCGNTCINIKNWRTTGKKTQVTVWIQKPKQKLFDFTLLPADSTVVIPHGVSNLYCLFQAGRKIKKVWISNLQCSESYCLTLSEWPGREINVIPAGVVSPYSCFGRKNCISLQPKTGKK